MFENVKKILIEETQSKAIDIAVSIASFLVQDIESYRMLSESPSLSIDDPSYLYYLETNSVLRAIRKQTDTSYIFTARYIDEQNKAYVLDGECPDSEFFSPFGSRDGIERYGTAGVPNSTGGRERHCGGPRLGSIPDRVRPHHRPTGRRAGRVGRC